MKRNIFNGKIHKKAIAMGIVFSLLICVVFSRFTAVFAEDEEDEIKPLVNGTVLMYSWTSVSGDDMNKVLKSFAVSASPSHVLITNDKKDKYITYYASGDNMKLYSVSDKSNDDECRVNSSYFISSSDLQTPVMIGSGSCDEDFYYDAGNGKEQIKEFRIGQYSKINPTKAANRMMKSGKSMGVQDVVADGKVITDEETAMYKAYKEGYGSTWSVAAGQIYDDDGDDEFKISDNMIKIWDTNPGWTTRDNGMYIDSSEVKCHRDADWEDYGTFYLWLGTEIEFSAINQDYVIHSNEVAVIDGSKSNALLMKGKKIIVEEGGVLSIKGIFLNNGYIECNGGTIILQEGSLMAPYNSSPCPDINVSTDTIEKGNGLLNIKGGELFIMSNAKLATDSTHYNGIRVVADKNNRMGKIVNYGMIIAPSIYTVNSMIYNRKSGVIYLGATYDNAIALKNSYIAFNDDNSIRAAFTTSTKTGNTFVIMSGNRETLVRNDGILRYISYPSGVKIYGNGSEYR